MSEFIIIAVLIGYVVAVTAGIPFVLLMLRALKMTDEQRKEVAGGIPNAGLVIGLIERTLVMTFVYLGEWSAIGLLLAAKSIIRFESAKQRHFAEYFIVGTLSSILFAIVVAMLVKLLTGIPWKPSFFD